MLLSERWIEVAAQEAVLVHLAQPAGDSVGVLQLLHRVETIIEAGRKAAKTSQGRSQIDGITICTEGYAEPGYGDPASGLVALGNWNDVSRYDGKNFIRTDNAPGRVARLLEKLDVTLEWSDEWETCRSCGKCVRTKPDSYSWMPSHAATDDGLTCHECIKADPTEYLQSLEGDGNRCVTIDLDLEAAGYKLLSDDYQNGLYGGQSDRPELIAEALREQGVERFIFNLDSTGQFDMSFSVYVHQDEYDRIDREEFEMAPTAGVDPAVQMQKALADASTKMATTEGGIKIAKCDLDSGTARVRVVSPEDFVAGKALDF